MKNLILSAVLILVSVMTYAKKGPQYYSEETKEVIQKMIEAHGGYEKWEQIETISFTTAMHSASLGVLRFWINDQVTEMNTRKTYQDWPLVGSKMAYDGEKVWGINWNVGNPPSHQQSVFFYYLNLPWLTQDENVKLGEVERLKHKAFDNEVYKIKMSFSGAPTLGKSENDTYTLFIDTKTYLLVGYEYTVGYGPMLDILGLPKDQKVFGPMLRKNNYFAEINGLKYAVLFTTHDSEMTTQYGDHAIYDLSFDKPFDESRMIMPENAFVDPAQDIRR